MEARETAALERRLRGLQRRLWLERSLFVLLLAPMGTMWLLPRIANGPTAIRVDGRTFAVVASHEAAEQVLAALKKEKTGPAAASASFTRAVTLTRAGRDAGRVLPGPEAIDRLRGAVSIQAPRAVILVDGTPITALPNEREASTALSLVKAHYAGSISNLVEEPRFKQSVTVVRRPAPTDLWCADAKAAAALLLHGRDAAPTEYQVAPGDTLGEIAESHHLTVDDLLHLNPGLRPSRVRVGRTLRVRPPQSGPVTVIARARVRRVPRNLPVPGPRRGPAEVTYENGVPVAAAGVTALPKIELPEAPTAKP